MAHGDLVGAAAVDRFADGTQRLRERLYRVRARHVSGPEMNLRRAAVVAMDQPMQDFGEEAALAGPEPPHDAEIDRNHRAVLLDEQVALVHVGVEEAVAHGVAQERLQHCHAEAL